MQRDCRGADVAGDAVGFVLEAWIQGDQMREAAFLVAMDRGSDGPLAFAQNLLDAGQEVGVDEKIFEAPILRERRFEAIEVAERLVHVGFLDLDIAHLDRGVALDDAGIGILAHALSVDRDILRYVDDKVAEDRRGA